VTGPARRELTACVVGAVLAGALALSAGGQAWARVTAEREPPLPPVTAALTGADAAPLVPAAGLVLLAAAVAVLAVRGPGRSVVGLLMAVAGGVLGWSGLRALSGWPADVPPDLPGVGRGGAVTVDTVAAWPVLAVVAGLLGVAAGLLAVVRGRAWPAMGRRYERTGDATPVSAVARRPMSDEDRAQAAWKALDRGEDPTSPAEDRP
jgi:uncharacterized membrane protein (TIGR02234 family)